MYKYTFSFRTVPENYSRNFWTPCIVAEILIAEINKLLF